MSARTFSPWQQPLADTEYDVAVVGGGVVGAATACALATLDSMLRVALVEAETLAFGASGRNAGFLLPGTHTDYASAIDAYGREAARRLWHFTAENIEAVAALDSARFDYHPSGSLVAAGGREEAERLKRSCALLAEDGVETAYLDAQTANAAMNSDSFYGALAVPTGGALHPAKLVRHLAMESSATILEGWPVTAVEPSAEGVRLSGPSGMLEARCVVLTVGAYLPRLVPALGGVVRPVRAQMLATAPVALFLDRPVYSHEGYFYLRQQPDGRLLLGGARHLHETEEVGYDDATTDVVQADLEAYLKRHFPEVGIPTVERRWSGTMGFSPDGLPALGQVPGVPGAVYATGFTGHGMGYSLRFGRLLAHLTLDRPDDAFDLFDGARFGSLARTYRPTASPSS